MAIYELIFETRSSEIGEKGNTIWHRYGSGIRKWGEKARPWIGRTPSFKS